MSSVWMALAGIMAVSHLALIVLLIAGGPLAMRWQAMVRLHVAAIIATGLVFLLGADCPLTVWQKWCLERGGREPYEGGFIEHYLVEPVTGGGATPWINAAIVATWLVPTSAAYTVRYRRGGA